LTSTSKQRVSADSTVASASSNRLARLIDDLKLSIERINFLNDINDYQLHFFNGFVHQPPPTTSSPSLNNNSSLSLLVMLFDKQNEENFRFGLEKSYQKSILETHAAVVTSNASAANIPGAAATTANRSVNTIAKLNVLFINDIDLAGLDTDYGQCELNDLIERSKFERFSLIKTFNNMSNKSSSGLSVAASKLPIGKYFVAVRYTHLICTGDESLNEILYKEVAGIEKESLIDLSLLPLAIRAQFKHIFEKLAEQDASPSAITEPPELNMIALDSHLVQAEINRKRDELIRDGIVRNSARPAEVRQLLARNLFADIPDLDRIMRKIEAELSSYYICERVSDVRKIAATAANGNVIQLEDANDSTATVSEDDLVKLNKIDALASYKCVQKYKELVCELVFDLVNLQSKNGNQIFLFLYSGVFKNGFNLWKK
jgi:hypothetical protein